jgi:hypothetical protein
MSSDFDHSLVAGLELIGVDMAEWRPKQSPGTYDISLLFGGDLFLDCHLHQWFSGGVHAISLTNC